MLLCTIMCKPLSTTKRICGEIPVSLPLPSQNVAKETEGVEWAKEVIRMEK